MTAQEKHKVEANERRLKMAGQNFAEKINRTQDLVYDVIAKYDDLLKHEYLASEPDKDTIKLYKKFVSDLQKISNKLH